MLEVVVITNTDESLDHDEVRERLSQEGRPAPVLVCGGSGEWRSLQDWAVFVCRSKHKLDKKLVLELEDFNVIVKLLLQNSSKKLTGDSEYLQSDLLEVQHSIKKWRLSGEAPTAEEQDRVIGEAVRSYPGFLTRCGLVDRWEVMRLCLGLHSEAGAVQTVVMVGLSEDERDLLEMVGEVRPAVVRDGDLHTSENLPAAELDYSACAPPQSEVPPDEAVSVLASYLRLLVCSKDEISLARAVTGPGLLSSSQFSSLRREAEAVQLPMFQTILSFVRKVELGGKSYQPGEDNQLHQLLPSLSQFSSIMEKLQTRLEETQGAVPAITAVLTLLRSWLTKQGFLTDMAVLDTMQRLLAEVQARQSCLEATPARGRMGRPAVKLLTGLLDLLGCLRLQTSDGVTGTPARQSRLVQTFTTPQPATILNPEDDVDKLVEEKSLSERLAAEDVTRTPVSRVSRPPRFRSSTDFTEGSPAVLRSAERGSVVTGGVTLRARAHHEDAGASPGVERTKEILQEIRDKDRLEREEQIENIKQNIKKTKRCLTKEVDGIVREKMGMKRKKEVDKTSPVKDKKPKKKKFSTPKGQRKMTSFFSR